MADPSNKKIMDLSINPDPTNAWAYVVESSSNWRVQLGVANGLAVYDGAGAIPVANGGTGATTAAGARTALGLGTIAVVNSPVPVANGGTGSTTAAGARTALGLGTMATETAADYALLASSPTFTGNLTIGGTFTSGGDINAGASSVIGFIFRSAGSSVYLGPNSAGTVTLRPNGIGSATNQTTYSTSMATFGTPVSVPGASFGSSVATGADLSNHIALYSTSYGFNVVSGAVQAVSNSVVRQQWTNAGVTITGTLTATGNGTFNTSDERLKSDIRTLQGGLDLACAMRGVRYTKDGEECVGFIAQEMQKVLPSVVIETDTPEKYLALSYEHITPVLVEAIKELRAQIEELKKPWWKKLMAKANV